MVQRPTCCPSGNRNPPSPKTCSLPQGCRHTGNHFPSICQMVQRPTCCPSGNRNPAWTDGGKLPVYCQSTSNRSLSICLCSPRHWPAQCVLPTCNLHLRDQVIYTSSG